MASSAKNGSQHSFPVDEAEFHHDTRISYSNDIDTHVLTDEEGHRWNWIKPVQKWTRAIDDADIAQQSQTYGAHDETADRKRKTAADEDSSPPAKVPKTASQTTKPQPKQERAPTAVFATNLPEDTTVDEIHQVFARFGLISESIETGEWRIKMYQDDDGNFKGEALIVYHRPESVSNAILMLDNSDFRIEAPQAAKMRVAVADSSYKRQKDVEPQPQQPRKGRDFEAERKKKQLKKKYDEMNSRLGDWSDDEPQAIVDKAHSSDKFLVLKAMFTLQQIHDDPSEILEIKEDVRDECEKYGTVTRVVLYDQEEDGIVVARFKSADEAARAVEVFDGRLFDGRRVIAYTSNGKEKFKKSGRDDDPEAEQARLDRLAKASEDA